jgi:hypothetical protein
VLYTGPADFDEIPGSPMTMTIALIEATIAAGIATACFRYLHYRRTSRNAIRKDDTSVTSRADR